MGAIAGSTLFTLRFYTPVGSTRAYQRTDLIDVDPDVTSLTFSKQLPGGYQTLQVGILSQFATPDGLKQMATLDRGVYAPDYAHVELWAGLYKVWEGRLALSKGTGGTGVTSLQATGYGVGAIKDTYLLPTANLSNTVTLRNLMALIQAQVPTFTAGDISGPAAPSTVLISDLRYKTPAQCLDMLTKQADGENLWQWAVWDKRRIEITAKIAPPVPDYHVPLDDTVSWSRDQDAAFGKVLVQFTDPTGGVPFTNYTNAITNPDFTTKYGVSRSQVIVAGQLVPPQAIARGNIWLLEHADPIPTYTITRSGGRGMELLRGGAEVPAYQPRPGQWVLIGDDMQQIVHVQHDGHAGSTTIQCNALEPGWGAMVTDLRRTAEHLIHNTSPISATSR